MQSNIPYNHTCMLGMSRVHLAFRESWTHMIELIISIYIKQTRSYSLSFHDVKGKIVQPLQLATGFYGFSFPFICDSAEPVVWLV